MLFGMDSESLKNDVEAFLAKGGKITKMRDCSPKEAAYRSMKLYKDSNNPNRVLRKPPPRTGGLPTVFSGYNSGKR
jgi:hypothetical protein